MAERRAPADPLAAQPKRRNSLLWVFEAFEEDPGYVLTKLFGSQAAYLDGRLYLAVADGKEPWNGLLVCTSYERQTALTTEFPQLVPHSVLPKWLYLSQTHPHFETIALGLAELALIRDARFGVDSQKRRRRNAAKTGKTKRRPAG